ncbi:protein of unknown function [Kyrpidia spormannii]|uniref:Uncharacterized protein n=1 Tax=Kyrpidia spormannii TaxID=2055160 RepID=A0A6F9EGV8_9BACL|nr:protein of unknown function [Kyrpidia spormannii]
MINFVVLTAALSSCNRGVFGAFFDVPFSPNLQQESHQRGRENQFIALRIGDPVVSVNGQSVTFPPELSGGRTLLS